MKMNMNFCTGFFMALALSMPSLISGRAFPSPSVKLTDPGSQMRTYLAHKLAHLLVAVSNTSMVGEAPPDAKIFNGVVFDSLSHLRFDVGCQACKDVVRAIDDVIQTDVSRALIADVAAEVCTVLKLEDDRVCHYLVREFKEEFIDVLTLHYLSPDQVCGTLLGESCAQTYDPDSDWNITFPDVPKPPVAPVNPPKAGSPTLRVLHLTDLHIDLMYQTGANAQCGEPICCRSNDGPPAPGTPGAGQWGDFRGCDVPLDLVVNALQGISQTQKPDLIYLTGDFPAHDVWNQSRSDIIRVLDLVTDLLMKYFPGVKVYPALGNHESAPVDSFPPDFITGNQSEKWLYDALVKSWIEKSGWLPQTTQKTLRRGGYYDVLVYPGLRIVSINANAGNPLNFWLHINATDPDGQLQWLVNVLQAAEKAKEKVHIIGHIIPSLTRAAWSKNYELIVKRYESTIRGQFFGHTHKDQFQIFYESVRTRRPVSVLYVAGAITPSGQNPGYRVYSMDGDYANTTWAVLDHETYYLNLTEANLTNKPIWRQEYTAKKAYNMTSLQPSEWNRVVGEMKKNESLFDQYYTYYHRLHDAGPCDARCRSDMICDIQTARADDTSYC